MHWFELFYKGEVYTKILGHKLSNVTSIKSNIIKFPKKRSYKKESYMI